MVDGDGSVVDGERGMDCLVFVVFSALRRRGIEDA